jgi:hypothetical protein
MLGFWPHLSHFWPAPLVRKQSQADSFLTSAAWRRARSQARQISWPESTTTGCRAARASLVGL